jgi:hypothetical protein
MQSTQKGITMSGFMLWTVLAIAVLLIGFKVGPAYFESFNIQKQLKAMASDPSVRSGDRRSVETAFVRRSSMENIQSIGASDIQVTKEGNGVVLSAEYSVKVPLFGNASACLDFNPSSAK